MMNLENPAQSVPDGPAPPRSRRQRVLLWACGLGFIAVLIFGLYHLLASTFGATELTMLHAGERAVEANDRLEAERICCLLEAKGSLDAARLIRGRMHLAEARALDEQLRANNDFGNA